MMYRETVLKFIKAHHGKTGKVPSIRTIAENVDGVTKSNFYNFFSGGINEALGLVGIQTVVEKPEAAMEARKKTVKKDGDSLVTLNRTQCEKFIALAYMDGKPVSMVIDEMLEDQRQIRQIMIETNDGILDSDIIDAILHPDLVYEGRNVSDIARKPWFIVNCNRCGDPLVFSEERDFNRWLFEIMPVLRRVFNPTCEDCLPKPYSIIRIPTR